MRERISFFCLAPPFREGAISRCPVITWVHRTLVILWMLFHARVPVVGLKALRENRYRGTNVGYISPFSVLISSIVLILFHLQC